ncbi:FAS1-like dehydratase domain-containing protein [Actinomadura chokoriensis]|uniref:FAS1-like dehydratase domain-containing protein n=1 Tax=Actinomadura chokoriensis TaxID=454156 RepID=UPI0031F92DA3
MTLLTDEIRALVGRTKTYTAPEPMGAAAGRYFGLAIGDHNPLYSDPAYARAHGLADVTAPPTLICETNQYANLPIGPDGDAGHNWGIEIPGTRKVRGGNRYVFHRRVLPSDVVTATWEIADITAKTNRAGAEMLIVTSRAVYTRQDGEPLAENEETIIFVSLEARA